MYSLKELFKQTVSEIVKCKNIDENEAKTIAFYLLEELFSANRLDIMLDKTILNKNLSENDFLEKKEILQSFIFRITQNEPLQYILGYEIFHDLRIKTSKNAIIPRPETAELVQIVQQHYPQKSPLKIWDICTGTGCIALALAHFFENSTVLGTDISLDALVLAQENKILNNIQNTWFLKKDVFEKDTFEENLGKSNQLNKPEFYLVKNSFDVIISNPPYICESEKKDMLPNVLDYEPHLALFVENENPLVFYEKILQISQIFLKKNGKIYFEINENFGKEMILLLEKYHFKNIQCEKDIRGKDRFVIGIMDYGL